MISRCVNHIYTLSPKLSSITNIFGSGSIFCVFASVASILIGKYDEYKKKNCIRKFRTQYARTLRLRLYHLQLLSRHVAEFAYTKRVKAEVLNPFVLLLEVAQDYRVCQKYNKFIVCISYSH